MDSSFNIIEQDGFVLYIRSDLNDPDLIDLLRKGPENIPENFQPDIIPASKHSIVCRFDYNGPVYFKKYLYRSVWDIFKHILRPCRAQRAFNAAEMLNDCGLKTPAVLALGIKRIGPFVVENFLVTKGLEDTVKLSDMLCFDRSVLTDKQLIDEKKLLTRLGEMAGTMHSKGVFHGDLRLGNILVGAEDGKYQFFLLDNERTKKFSKIPKRLRIKNLVQLNMFPPQALTNSLRMRFFIAYRQQAGKSACTKGLIAKVLKRTSQRLAGKS